ncbi:MAG: polymer-forming cytoskeletal protein [Chloroflexi bacterium]|nr:polymer-forming cytoskeletal protein [Chloroflexota bacterium]
MFRRRADAAPASQAQSAERITSVLAEGTSLAGKLTGKGGLRVEGTYDGEVNFDGLFVIGPTGRVTCKQLRAKTVIIAGALRGDILAEKVEIRATGRVWGDVTTASISTQDGAFLRGQIQMEETVDLGYDKKATPAEGESAEPSDQSKEKVTEKLVAKPRAKSKPKTKK